MRYLFAVAVIPLLLLFASCIDVSQEDDPVFGTYIFSYTKGGVVKKDRYRIDYKTAEATEDGYSIYNGDSLDDSSITITLFWTDDLSQIIFFLGQSGAYVGQTSTSEDGSYMAYIFDESDDGSLTGCAYRIPSSMTSIPKCYSLDSDSKKSFSTY